MINLRREEKKAMEISSELMHYFFSENIHTFSIYTTFHDEYLEVSARGKTKTEPKSVDKLVHIMNSKRLAEVEDYYDTIIGFNHRESDYNLLGNLIDEAEFNFQDEVLSFVIKRYF